MCISDQLTNNIALYVALVLKLFSLDPTQLAQFGSEASFLSAIVNDEQEH